MVIEAIKLSKSLKAWLISPCVKCSSLAYLVKRFVNLRFQSRIAWSVESLRSLDNRFNTYTVSANLETGSRLFYLTFEYPGLPPLLMLTGNANIPRI